MTQYYLFKQLSPGDDGPHFLTATLDRDGKTLRVVFWDTDEDKARAQAHRLEHGDD